MSSIFEWAEAYLGHAKRRRNSIEADCPFCGKPRHLYVQATRGYYRCYAKNCGASGRDISGLIAEVEGVDRAEARRRLLRRSVQFTSQRTEAPISLAASRRLSEAVKPRGAMSVALGAPQGEGEAAGPAIEAPRGTIPVWDGRTWRMPRYLTDRAISRRTARKYNIGFRTGDLCDLAPRACKFLPGERTCVDYRSCRYADRIILPIECPNGKAFTARSVIAGERLRYLNPSYPKGKLLYGWNQAVEPEIELVLVEGPFDALRLATHGIAAVAIMGLFLSSDQRSLLSTANLTAITVMLDSGVIEDAYKLAESVSELSPLTFIAGLPEGRDPGELDKEAAWEVLRNSAEYRAKYRGESSRVLTRVDQLRVRYRYNES